MCDRFLLGKLSMCAWNVASAFLKSAVPRDGAVLEAGIAIQPYGDVLNFNPHPHAIVTDGFFVGVPGFHAEDLEEAGQTVKECPRVYRQEDDLLDQGKALSAPAIIWDERGDLTQAIALERQALAVGNKLSDIREDRVDKQGKTRTPVEFRKSRAGTYGGWVRASE